MSSLDSTPKYCTKCGAKYEQPALEFHRNRARPDGLEAQCKACRRADAAERMRQRRQLEPERIKEEKRRYYQRNREAVLASVKRYVEQNKQQVYERKRQARAENSEQRAEAQREWYALNDGAAYRRMLREADPEHHREVQRRWRENNPDKVRSYDAAKRAARRQAEGRYSVEDVRCTYQEQSGRCYWCGCDVSDDYQVDHIVALARGGTNWPDNICVACSSCNAKKWALDPEEFRRRLLNER